MTEERAIPEGYMTTGEAAKKMGVSVRTLQYYDQKGLLPPSGESSGGRRLYTDKDLVKLHQILSLKSLGFSLDEIKNSLVSLEKPAEVAELLREQAAGLRQKIGDLVSSLAQIEKLRDEVLQMQTVDFKRYADIIINLQNKNDYYHLIKYFDEESLQSMRTRFDAAEGEAFMDRFSRVNEAILALEAASYAPDSPECQAVMQDFWDLVMEFTKGDLSLMAKLMEVGQTPGSSPEEKAKQARLNAFLGPALGIFLERQGSAAGLAAAEEAAAAARAKESAEAEESAAADESAEANEEEVRNGGH